MPDDQPKQYRIILRPLRQTDRHADPLEAENPDPDLEELTPHRIVDADHIGYIDNATLLVGIDPGISTYQCRCIGSSAGHADRLYKKRHTPEFYSVGKSRTGVDPSDPSHSDYIVTRKFRKILSINIDNVISINGKPVMGRLDNLDQGVQHLGLDEDWSVDNISDLLED